MAALRREVSPRASSFRFQVSGFGCRGTDDRGQRAEDREQRAEGRWQRTEGRGQMTDDRGQKVKNRSWEGEKVRR